MLLKELKEIIDRVFDRESQSRVVLRLNRPSIGPIASCDIESVSIGFDWNHGKIIFSAKEPVVEKPLNMKLFDAAHDLLFQMLRESMNKKRLTWRDEKVQEIYDLYIPDWRESLKSLF